MQCEALGSVTGERVAWREAQERRVVDLATQTGCYRHALIYYATLRDWARFRTLGAYISAHGEDRLVYSILSLSDQPDGPVPDVESVNEIENPYIHYMLTKHHLRQGDVGSALRVAKHLLQRDRTQPVCLNIIAKYLHLNGEHADARQLAQTSLALSKDQQDMLALATSEPDAVPEYKPYLDPAPQPFDVSFYVPVHNGEAYLAKTLDGLLGQSIPLHEVIVVDDGSTDATVHIAQSYPVRLIRFEENRGLAAGRNAAVQAATTSLVGSLDADVFAEPDYTASILSEFEWAEDNLAGVGGRLIETYTTAPADAWRAKSLRQGWYPTRMYFGPMPPPGTKESDLFDMFFLNGCNNIFRRDFVLAAGGYDERFRTNSEDGQICVDLRTRGRHLAFTRTAVTRHLRCDSVYSVLKTSWNYGYWGRDASGIYESGLSLLRKLSYSFTLAHSLLNSDAEDGAAERVIIDFLLMYQYMFHDIHEAIKRGLLSEAEGASVQAALLEPLLVLNRRTGHPVQDRVRNHLAPLLLSHVSGENPLNAEQQAAIEVLTKLLRDQFESYPDWLPELLSGGF